MRIRNSILRLADLIWRHSDGIHEFPNISAAIRDSVPGPTHYRRRRGCQGERRTLDENRAEQQRKCESVYSWPRWDRQICFGAASGVALRGGLLGTRCI